MYAEARAHLHTVCDLLRFAVSRFQEADLSFGHGTGNAYDEAAFLILHTLHLPVDRLEPFLHARLLPAEIDSVLNIIQRRVQERLPAPYLTGEAYLRGYPFKVSPDVLIPRSHIAGMLDEDLQQWIEDPAQVKRALDLCTGSGCLAILLALGFPQARVDGIDISRKALAIAQENVARYQLSDRITLIESDLFNQVPAARYDLIISNPPYVTARAMAALPAEYRHEPSLALAAGTDGLDIVRRLLAQSRDWLAPNGVLMVEVGGGKAASEAAFPTLPFVWLTADTGEEEVFVLRAQDL